MVFDKNSVGNLSESDKMFALKIAQTLDKSVSELDELSAQRLKNVRQYVLAQPVRNKPRWIGVSVAASLTLMLLTPLAWHQYTLQTSADDAAFLSQEIPLDAQEMDDMEMLMAMGDIDA